MPITIRIINTTTSPNHSVVIPDATKTAAGLMSAADKLKLDTIATGVQTQIPLEGNGTTEAPFTIADNSIDGCKFFKNEVSGPFVSRTVQGLDGSGSIPLVNIPSGSQVIAALYFDGKTKQLDNGVGKFFSSIIDKPNMLTQFAEVDVKAVQFVLIILRNGTR